MSETRLVHVVDDEEAIRRSIDFLLRTAGFDVQKWPDGESFLKGVAREVASCVLLDVRMPGMDGLQVQAAMAENGINFPVIVLTGHGDISTAVQAMRAGAVDFLEKPLTPDDLLQAVRTALAPERGLGSDGTNLPVSHAAARWAEAVVKVIDAPHDPRTMELWGRHIGASAGSLRNWCRMAGLSPKRSLNVARMIRAISYSAALKRPEDAFNVTDRRTLRQLLSLGDPNGPPSVPETIDEFFARQRWISSPSAVQELKRLLKARRGRIWDEDESD